MDDLSLELIELVRCETFFGFQYSGDTRPGSSGTGGELFQRSLLGCGAVGHRTAPPIRAVRQIIGSIPFGAVFRGFDFFGSVQHRIERRVQFRRSRIHRRVSLGSNRARRNGHALRSTRLIGLSVSTNVAASYYPKLRRVSDCV